MKMLCLIVLSMFALESARSQPYAGAFIGFNTSGLKGAIKTTTQGGTTVGNVADGGSTAFTFGVNAGYQIFPSNFAGGWYKLDLNLDASYQTFSYLENGYNSANGSGKFAANGLSGGGTSIIALDIMPINRLTIPRFKLLSPYIGIGLSLNIMNTHDVTVGPPSQSGTLAGYSDFKMGLLVFYGVVIRASDLVEPYLQFKHMIPFGSETQFTTTYQPTGGQAGGSQTVQFAVQDVPGHFSLTGGVRINF
ncbi:MAG TPA: hypothetical protein VMF59_12940 [Bacteroidota bacterium]|nr:hypothetical protein [Bacteroidota bacterium]